MNTKRSSRDYIVRAAMTLLVMLLTSATAWAEKETVSYIDENGKEKEVEATILTSETDISSSLSGGWYIVKNTNPDGLDVSFNSQVSFDNNTSLILADGAHIEIKGDNGIVVQNGSLTIYGQSGGTGSLSTKAIGDNGDGIYATGNISIIGGIITTTSDNNYGITTNNGDITINGGIIKVTATGENGIDATGNVTINGGNVNANGEDYGIAAEGTVTLNGGIVTANGTGNSDSRAGISAKKGASTIYLGGAIVIASSYSGTVTVKDDVTYTKKDLTTNYNGNIDASTVSTLGGVIIFPTTCFGIASGNDGSEGKPYAITSPEELQLLSSLVNEGNTFTSKYIQLRNDIDMYGIDFSPIGFKTYTKFCGNFDGGGYIISNLYINIDDTCIGLFGLVEDDNATIQNITISNATINGKEYVGGIVGSLDNGSIKNCFVINSKITSSIAVHYYGAIVGYCKNNNYLSYNYYGNSTVNEEDSKVGCGTDSGSHDVEENDGVVSATILSESETVPSELSGKVVFRRVFTGGSASTICMPFAYTPNESDGTFYTFEGITKETKDNKTEYVATMQETNKAPSSLSDPLSANTPYLFKPTGTGIKPVLFHGSAAYKNNPSYKPSPDSPWTFKGTYAVVSWDDDNNRPEGIYGFSAQAVEEQSISQGQFVKVGEYVKIRSMRAYLQYTGSSFPNTRGTLSEEELPDRILVRLVDSDGDITGIGELDMKTGEVTFDNGWYTLEGVRLSGKPAKHGIYVNNGRKYMIK